MIPHGSGLRCASSDRTSSRVPPVPGEAAWCVATGIREARADAEVAVVPMADGGEGTLDAALANV